MDDEKGAVEKVDEWKLDDDFDPLNPDTALTAAEIDLLLEKGVFDLIGDVAQDIVEDAMIGSLSPNQLEAAALVAMGLNDIEVGRMVGVRRQTINVWRNHNYYFKKEIEKKRAEIWETYKVQYRILVPRAIDALGKALDFGDEHLRTKTAMYILRTLKIE